MSTILDALKKVERARESPREQMLHTPALDSPTRRRISPSLIVVCAVVGFAAGVTLALWRDEPPDPVSPLADVPPAPVLLAPPAPELPERQARAADSIALPPEAPVPEAGAPTPARDVPVLASVDAPPAGPEATIPDSSTREAGAPPSVGSAVEASPFIAARPPTAAPPTVADIVAAARPAAPPSDEIVAVDPPPNAAESLEEPPPPEEPAAAPESSQPAETVVDTGRSPSGAPRVVLSFLQWSPQPERRFAFISIDGSPSQRVQEGDAPAGLTVAAITRDGIRLKREGTVFVIRPRH